MQLTGNVSGLIQLLGGGSDVTIEPILLDGVEIMKITVDGVIYNIYSPEPGDDVSVTPIQLTGTKIATITIGENNYDIYSPTITPGDSVSVTPIQLTGTKIATISVNNVPVDIYAPSGGGHAYSTSEHVVGTWIDGRFVYEKTLSFGVISGQSYSLDLDILSSEIDFCFLVSDGSYINHGTLPIPYVHGVDSNSNIGGFINYNNTNVSFDFRIGQNSAGYITDGIITIRYVKKVTT